MIAVIIAWVIGIGCIFLMKKNTTRRMDCLRNICPGCINPTYSACSTLCISTLRKST